MERPIRSSPPFSPALHGVNFVSNSSLSASRVEAASLLPPPRPAPCGILFFEHDRNTTRDLRFFEKNVRCTHHNIVFAFRHRRIIAPKRDSLFAGALLDLDLVTKRDRREEGLDFVKAIAATAENSQPKIDLRGSDHLHNLQFALSFRAKSRNLLLMVEILRCLDFARNDKRCIP